MDEKIFRLNVKKECKSIKEIKGFSEFACLLQMGFTAIEEGSKRSVRNSSEFNLKVRELP